MQNGEITNINILEHRHERGKAAEAITNKIVDEQKIGVDAILGATNSGTWDNTLCFIWCLSGTVRHDDYLWITSDEGRTPSSVS